MASNVHNGKQQTAGKSVILKDGFKDKKGFGRYAFYKSGKVINKATGNTLIPSVQTSEGPALQLTNDKGVRERVTVADIKSMFIEPKKENTKMEQATNGQENGKPAPAQDAATVKDDMILGVAVGAGKGVSNTEQPATTRGRSKLSYDKAMDIRRRLASGEKRGAIAKDLSVDTWTIQAIAVNYSYKLREGDSNPIPPSMMEQFTSKNLPSAWKGKTREEVRELAGYRLL